jgi:DNA-binding MarR family transcriptional regulator
MFTTPDSSSLAGSALDAWRGYLRSHAAILRELDAELVTEHGLTTRDYEVMLYLSQAEGRRLPMSAVAERTRLTRSGITRLIDGLVGCGYIERDACSTDARVSYAHLTDAGYDKLRQAGCTHVASIQRLFVSHFTETELRQLAELLGRLPGSALGPCTVDEATADASAAAAA